MLSVVEFFRGQTLQLFGTGGEDMSIEYYGDKSAPTAIVIRKNFESEGIKFFSPLDYPQQLGYMKRPAGYEVVPHRHNQIPRTIENTQEVLLIRSGECLVTLFDDFNVPTDTISLSDGDTRQLLALVAAWL